MSPQHFHELGHRTANRLGVILAALVIALCWHDSRAADGSPWWVNVGGVSWHAEGGHNGVNPGLGIEYRASDEWALGAGLYRNSSRRTSRYAGAIWTPLRLATPAAPLYLGAQAGVVDGYPYRHGAPIPAAALVADLRGSRAALLLAYVPGVERAKSCDTVALQIRIRF